MTENVPESAIDEAARQGDVSRLRTWHDAGQLNTRYGSRHCFYVPHYATLYGHWSVVAWWNEVAPRDCMWYDIGLLASARGHLHIVKRLSPGRRPPSVWVLAALDFGEARDDELLVWVHEGIKPAKSRRGARLAMLHWYWTQGAPRLEAHHPGPTRWLIKRIRHELFRRFIPELAHMVFAFL